MYKLSERSTQKFVSLDHRLQKIILEVLEFYDISVVEGNRQKQKQDELFEKGFTKVQWPNSKHNRLPSKAMDIQPYPIDLNLVEQMTSLGFKERAKFYYLAGLIKYAAIRNGVNIRWGGDWNGDNSYLDNNFDDLFHFEIIG